MRYTGIPGLRIGTVPASVLLAITGTLEKLHRRRYEALYRDCTRIVGRKISADVSDKALAYLLRDKAITVSHGVVRQTPRWKRSEIVAIAKESREVGRRRGRSVRKAARKKSSYPTGRRVVDYGPLSDFAGRPPRKTRRYRDNPEQRYRIRIFWATDRERDSLLSLIDKACRKAHVVLTGSSGPSDPATSLCVALRFVPRLRRRSSPF